ncbi:MAG: hypothetical protein ABIH83_03355 [Candidatus Micrarchaeota archaeon]
MLSPYLIEKEIASKMINPKHSFELKEREYLHSIARFASFSKYSFPDEKFFIECKNDVATYLSDSRACSSVLQKVRASASLLRNLNKGTASEMKILAKGFYGPILTWLEICHALSIRNPHLAARIGANRAISLSGAGSDMAYVLYYDFNLFFTKSHASFLATKIASHHILSTLNLFSKEFSKLVPVEGEPDLYSLDMQMLPQFFAYTKQEKIIPHRLPIQRIKI